MQEESQKRHVLIATDDTDYGATLARFLEGFDYTVERCHDSQGVIRITSRRDPTVVLLDLNLVGEGDLDLISFVRRQSPETQVVLLFEPQDVDLAIDGIRRGAYFYLPKSCQPSDVAMIVTKSIRAHEAQTAMGKYENTLLEEMAGNTPAMKRVVELVSKVAPTDSAVLLLGESGTGKEVIANMVHRLSQRRELPFVAINCAALPEQLLESELFGHVKGAFTGADSDKTGLFEEADGGTLFLDEVAEMPLLQQAKLLRVLQNGEIRRVGASTTGHVDVRILAATNRDLVKEVEQNRFREDLYFRLNVIQIAIPPLRERPDAIGPLVRNFLNRYNKKFGRDVQSIDEHAWSLLQNYKYPGNIRELESIVAHAVIMADTTTIRVSDLPDSLRLGSTRLALPDYGSTEIPTIEEMERRLIETALQKLEGNQTEVAKRLGISRSTLWRKMKDYGLSRTGEEEETAVHSAG